MMIRGVRSPFILAFLLAVSMAALAFGGSTCPLLVHPDASEEREFQNVCQLIANPTLKNYYGATYADNISLTITVSVQDTYYPIAPQISTTVLSGFTFFPSTASLTCNNAGLYLANWSFAFMSVSANQEAEGAVLVNGSPMLNTSTHSQAVNSNRPISESATGLISLKLGDAVQLGISNHSGATNLSIAHMNLTLLKIAN